VSVKQLLAGASACLLAFGAASAHHSASAFFDLDATVSLEGVVTGARLINPHSYYRVTTDDGVDWAWESAGTWTALAKAGWSGDTLPAGTRVRMSGTPARTGRPIARFSTIAATGPTLGDDMMILVGLDVFGVGRPAWFERVRELGSACDNGVNDCSRLDPNAIETLQDEFGNIGIWSGLDD
jgi:hypothetical protein